MSRFLSKDKNLFLLFYFYSVLMCFLVQFVVLPYFFPAFHWGKGLLLGNDSVNVHTDAIQHVILLANQGVNPFHGMGLGFPNPMRGIATLLYSMFGPYPALMIPIQAGLHALAAFTIVKILSYFISLRRVAILCALPLLLSPSALCWYTQLLKDTFYICGTLLFVWGWVVLLEASHEVSNKQFRQILILFFSAGLLTWASKPDTLIILLLFSALNVLVLHYLKYSSSIVWDRKSAILVLFLFVFFLSLPRRALVHSVIPVRSQENSTKEDAVSDTPATSDLVWQSSTSLPSFIDEKLKTVSLVRRSFIFESGTASTTLDQDVIFHKADDIVRYLPRAIQLALFSPFPDQWFGSGSNQTSRIFRIAGAAETALLYLCFPFLLYFLYCFRKRPAVWSTLGLCLFLITLLALVTPNIGTLFRFRFVFSEIFIAMGLAGLLRLRSQRLGVF